MDMEEYLKTKHLHDHYQSNPEYTTTVEMLREMSDRRDDVLRAMKKRHEAELKEAREGFDRILEEGHHKINKMRLPLCPVSGKQHEVRPRVWINDVLGFMSSNLPLSTGYEQTSKIRDMLQDGGLGRAPPVRYEVARDLINELVAREHIPDATCGIPSAPPRLPETLSELCGE
jgi:predicted transcriptional regulator